MRASDLFWEKFGDLTRGEAQELLAELLLQEDYDDEGDLSDGVVIDALIVSLNRLYTPDKFDKFKELLDEYEEYEEEDDDVDDMSDGVS